MTGCAVIGLGIMGSMALLALARRGVECVGYECGPPAHPDGASGGGETRIFRSVSPDGPAYDRLLARSRELWQDLSGPFQPTGALTIGPDADPRLAALHARPGLEVVPGPAARERWPEHRVDDGESVLLDPGGGLLAARGSVRAALDEAVRLGARVRPWTTVTSVTRRDDRAVVRTADGRTDTVGCVVVATGRWTDHHDAGFADRIDARRVVLTWFDVTTPAAFRAHVFPPGLRVGGRAFTFFPTVDTRTIKINMQVPQPAVADPLLFHPAVEAGYARSWASALPAHLPRIAGPPVRTESYVESYTPARRGMVRLHERGFRAVALGGFSGQGFKYAPALGELAAGFAATGVAPARAAFAA